MSENMQPTHPHDNNLSYINTALNSTTADPSRTAPSNHRHITYKDMLATIVHQHMDIQGQQKHWTQSNTRKYNRIKYKNSNNVSKEKGNDK